MLPGLIVAYPHPSAISCSIAGGSDGAGGAPPGRPGPADPPPVGPKPRAGAGGAPAPAAFRTPSEHHHHGYWPGRVRRRHESHLDLDGEFRICGVVHGADQFLTHDRSAPDLKLLGPIHAPRDLWSRARHAAEHFPIEVLDDLRSPLFPPRVRAGDLLAVLERQRIGKLRVRIGDRPRRSWRGSAPTRSRSAPDAGP